MICERYFLRTIISIAIIFMQNYPFINGKTNKSVYFSMYRCKNRQKCGFFNIWVGGEDIASSRLRGIGVCLCPHTPLRSCEVFNHGYVSDVPRYADIAAAIVCALSDAEGRAGVKMRGLPSHALMRFSEHYQLLDLLLCDSKLSLSDWDRRKMTNSLQYSAQFFLSATAVWIPEYQGS